MAGSGYGSPQKTTNGGSNQVTYGYDNLKSAESVTGWNSNSTTYAYDGAAG
ncbi:hypothetical protein [Candidatus Amarobacter glycogenicus]|uniref:hypothetical protein n=1 Tax=Candidatus Amarobacter glycogenicus TaxID=3140699 RepID=UPI0031355F0E|nr:hypothetical protein [Dehalococcoidia bacterium]